MNSPQRSEELVTISTGFGAGRRRSVTGVAA